MVHLSGQDELWGVAVREVLVVQSVASLMHALLCHRGGGIVGWEILREAQKHVLHLAFEACLVLLLFGEPSSELFHLFLEMIVVGVKLLVDVPDFSGGVGGEICHVLIHRFNFMLKGL